MKKIFVGRMPNFILLTRDGYMLTNTNESTENMQVLSIVDGVDAEDAFAKFKADCQIVTSNGFEDVIVFELKDNSPKYFSLSE